MPKSQQRDAIRSIERLADAYAEARGVLRDSERTLRRSARDLQENGESYLSSALEGTPPAVYRDQVNAALEKIDESRHEMRLRLFALALSQGYSISELARMWGFSRQLASRLVGQLDDATADRTRQRKVVAR